MLFHLFLKKQRAEHNPPFLQRSCFFIVFLSVCNFPTDQQMLLMTADLSVLDVGASHQNVNIHHKTGGRSVWETLAAVEKSNKWRPIVCSEPLFLDLGGKRHEVKERCEGTFIRTQEKTTVVFRESDCTHTLDSVIMKRRRRMLVMKPLWWNYNVPKMDYKRFRFPPCVFLNSSFSDRLLHPCHRLTVACLYIHVCPKFHHFIIRNLYEFVIISIWNSWVRAKETCFVRSKWPWLLTTKI